MEPTDPKALLAAYKADDNTYWAVDAGHWQNVLDYLIERSEAMEAVAEAAGQIEGDPTDWQGGGACEQLWAALAKLEEVRRG